jgi:pimeloyl-ACP methyl ester carboxylesterase
MSSGLAEGRRLIAFDMPGHGDSGDAPEPWRTYSRPGLAKVAMEVLERLGVGDVALFGWSLAGHIALEMAPRLPRLKGLMISGAPPVGRANMADGFRRSPHRRLAGQEHLNSEEVDDFGRAVFGPALDPVLRKAIKRTDGLARRMILEAARGGGGVDQRWVVEHMPEPLAVVNGGADPLVNLDYFDRLAYANLWKGHCHRLSGLGHAPFLEAPEVFNLLFERFLDDLVASEGPSCTR